MGLVTTTETVPLVPRSLAETAMVNCEALTKVALRKLPFQVTDELDRKFEPVIVRVKPLDPAAALLGEIDWIEGAGFPLGGGGVELPPPHEQSSKETNVHSSAPDKPRSGLIAMSFASQL